jgi:hypothetical protein
MASAEPLSGMYWTELREATAIQPGSAVDGSEALMTVDDGATVPITTILSTTIEDDQDITAGAPARSHPVPTRTAVGAASEHASRRDCRRSARGSSAAC